MRMKYIAMPTLLYINLLDNHSLGNNLQTESRKASSSRKATYNLAQLLIGQEFSKIEVVTIVADKLIYTSDLKELLESVLNSKLHFKCIFLCCKDIDPESTERLISSVRSFTDRYRIPLEFKFLIDQACSVYQTSDNHPNQLARILYFSRSAVSAGIPVHWQIEVNSQNIYHLEGLYLLAESENIDIAYHPHEGMDSVGNNVMPFNINENLFFRDFIEYGLLADTTQPPHRRHYYLGLAKQLKSGIMEKPLCFQATILQVNAEIEIYSHLPDLAKYSGGLHSMINFDAHCNTSTSSGGWMNWFGRIVENVSPLYLKANFAAQAATILYEGAVGIIRAFIGQNISARKTVNKNIERPNQFTTATLIGAYGGEHVGDAGILGGVLLRLNQRYGIVRANLVSFRPEHTERWVRGLETPVDVKVIAYKRSLVEQSVYTTDCLVFAGGPLMDLPMLLVKHLNVAATARLNGKHFIIDRVGIGPFKRQPSRWVARWIIELANEISVRTSSAASSPELKGLASAIEKDPAFDYLATRSELKLLSKKGKESVLSLLQGTENRLLIGINLRPIRHIWSTQGQTYSMNAEEQFLNNFADTLRKFHRQSTVIPSFIYFPMNPIQFGQSDLFSAYRLHSMIGKEVDFRIWEFDPDIDDVLFLLKHLDIAITMRFHACIFALSQAMPVLGIDYYVGKGGKVGEMFSDFGKAEDFNRIDSFESDWMLKRLQHYADNFR